MVVATAAAPSHLALFKHEIDIDVQLGVFDAVATTTEECKMKYGSSDL
jgi:hypothetical protein